jgi:hypothetical protein
MDREEIRLAGQKCYQLLLLRLPLPDETLDWIGMKTAEEKGCRK